MTVSELIQTLLRLPSDAKVVGWDDGNADEYEITGAEFNTDEEPAVLVMMELSLR